MRMGAIQTCKASARKDTQRKIKPCRRVTGVSMAIYVSVTVIVIDLSFGYRYRKTNDRFRYGSRKMTDVVVEGKPLPDPSPGRPGGGVRGRVRVDHGDGWIMGTGG